MLRSKKSWSQIGWDRTYSSELIPLNAEFPTRNQSQSKASFYSFQLLHLKPEKNNSFLSNLLLTMQRSSSLALRTTASSSTLTTLLNHASSTCVIPKHSFSALSLQPNLQKLQEGAIPGDFVKWGSLGFCRTSSFATGFTPLQRKPLDSIMDIERVKDRSPEDIASIWDDVMSQNALFISWLLLWCFFHFLLWVGLGLRL